MDKLKWIFSTGGPIILISDKSFNLWSGILKRSSYLKNKIEETEDFLNEDETDYGKACSIQNYVGAINIGDDAALVLRDESLSTTIFQSVNGIFVIARWYYGEDKIFVDKYLKALDLNSIESWEFEMEYSLSTNSQFLLDSACSAGMINKDYSDCLLLNMDKGFYKISTSFCEPNDNTRLILHKLVKLNS
jgi:Immunity protein 21